MNSATNRRFEHTLPNATADQAVTPRRQSSRNILPVRTNLKAGGREEISAQIHEWLASRANEMPADETAV